MKNVKEKKQKRNAGGFDISFIIMILIFIVSCVWTILCAMNQQSYVPSFFVVVGSGVMLLIIVIVESIVNRKTKK